MKYTVASNWDIDLLDAIDYPEVHSVFAGLPNTPLSGGRSSVMINEDDFIRGFETRDCARLSCDQCA